MVFRIKKGISVAQSALSDGVTNIFQPNFDPVAAHLQLLTPGPSIDWLNYLLNAWP